MAQDNNNNIWVSYGSSESGVSMYDGNKFTHFRENDGLFNNKVNDIMVDNIGNIWFANGFSSTGGISKYDGSLWTTYSYEKGLPHSAVMCIAQDTNGDILIGTFSRGTYLLKNDTITPFCWESYSTDYIRDIYLDNSGNIWVATGNQAYIYNNDNWSIVNPSEPGKYEIIKNIDEDETGRILFSTTEGFSIMDGNTFTYYNTEDNLPHEVVYDSYAKEGSIWIGTQSGVAVLENDILTVYSTNDNGLISNEVNSVFEDDSSNLWFCTQWGISKYNNSTWTNYEHTEEGNEIKWVSCSFQDKDGNLWFGTVNGVFKYNHSTWEVFTYIDGIYASWIKGIVQDGDGNIWFAGWNYLYKYDGNSWTHYNDTSGFQSNYIDAIHLDSSGKIWLGSRSGISMYYGNAFSHYVNGVDFDITTPIYSIFEDKDGQIYAVSKSNILTFQNDNWEKLPISGYWFHHGFCDDANQIWLSTIRKGLIKYNKDSWENFTINDGTSSNHINSSFRTEKGVFYLCTDFGITEIVPEIEVSAPEVSTIDNTNNYSISMTSEGITKPYWFSIDGTEFFNNNGEFNNLQELSFILSVTNIYDTIQIVSCDRNINVESCDFFISPSEEYVWTTSGTYYDTIPNSIGCDSIMTINLTINNASTSEITVEACDSYTSPSGKVFTVSDIYLDTIPNATGCDSIITIGLTINNASTSEITVEACDSYTSPSGKVFTVSDTYLDTIPNATGCDSIITIDLTIDCTNSISKNSIFPVSIYPNPFNDFVIIELDEIHELLTLELFDLTGKLILKNTYENTKQITYNIEVSSGNYILKLSNNKNNVHIVELIKK